MEGGTKKDGTLQLYMIIAGVCKDTILILITQENPTKDNL